jgi:hypothetical protein
MTRRVSALMLALGLSSACGGARPMPSPPPMPGQPPKPALERVAGGPQLFGCWGAGVLTVHRPLRAFDWRFPAEGPPQLIATRGERPASDGCGPARTTVREVPADVGDGRLVTVTPGALGLVRDGREIWQRRAAGAFDDAVVYRGMVIVVGPEGLFRWSGVAGAEPIAVPLPDALAGRSWRALLRDGETLWLTDAEGLSVRVAPTTTAFESLRVVGEPARLLPPDLGLRVPVAGGRIEATLGGEGLRLLDDRGMLARLVETPPVRALLPLHAGHRVLVAGPDGLLVVRVDVRGHGTTTAGAEVEVRWPLGGPTARLFDLGDRLVAVGAYGLLTIDPGR